MAFTYTLNGRVLLGTKWLAFGTYQSSGGSTGGTIQTGLSKINNPWIQPIGSAVTNQPVVNETYDASEPLDGSFVIVTAANESGYWFALGEI